MRYNIGKVLEKTVKVITSRCNKDWLKIVDVIDQENQEKESELLKQIYTNEPNIAFSEKFIDRLEQT